MKFKIDENLPTETADFFRSSGYETETVYSESMQGCSDQFLIRKCQEEDRVLITLDTHFSNIIAYPPENNQGILVLRVKDQSKETVLKAVVRLLAGKIDDLAPGQLWIVDEARIRVRGKKFRP